MAKTSNHMSFPIDRAQGTHRAQAQASHGLNLSKP